MRRIGGFARAIESVEGTLQSVDIWRGLRPHMAKVYWAEVAGEPIASVSQVERVENGPDRCVLIVRTKNAVWANELTLLKGRLIDGLNERLGGHVITDLRFRGSGLKRLDVHERGRDNRDENLPDRRALDETPLHESERHRIEVAVSEIADPALRDLVYRSLTTAAHTALWKRKHGWAPCAFCGALTAPTVGSGSVLCAVCQATRP